MDSLGSTSFVFSVPSSSGSPSFRAISTNSKAFLKGENCLKRGGNILFIHDNKDKRKVAAASAKLLQILDLV